MEREMAPKVDMRTEIAIIGAGVAGCYAAFRLSQICPDKSIHVYGAADRFGGRLWSAPAGAAPSGVIELGGMTFSSAHENVIGLASFLGLEKTPICWRCKDYFLRGCSLPGGMFADAGAVPYRLEGAERGKDPYQLALHALMQIIPELPSLWPFAQAGPFGNPAAAARYLREVEVGGQPLHAWGIGCLLDRTISHEARELLSATLGSRAALRRGAASDAVATLMWEMNPRQSHYMLAGGYQQLPLALQRASEGVVRFFTGRRLKRIAMLTNGFRLHFDDPNGEHWVEAGAVILAIPKRAIELVELDEALVGDQFHRDLRAISCVPACRLYLGFERRWWDDGEAAAKSEDAVEIAASFTDLPIGQCYRFSRPGDDGAVLMAAFADDDVGIFTDLASQTSRDACPYPLLPGGEESLRASRAMVEAACRQLQAMHPGVRAPAPSGALFVNWGADPYGAGWHVFAPGTRSWEIRERMRKPNPKADFFLCGDAFAHLSGWVEGAINNTEAMLEKHFGASRPAWAPDGYTFET
jgi:monoamine oxidase